MLWKRNAINRYATPVGIASQGTDSGWRMTVRHGSKIWISDQIKGEEENEFIELTEKRTVE